MSPLSVHTWPTCLVSLLHCCCCNVAVSGDSSRLQISWLADLSMRLRGHLLVFASSHSCTCDCGVRDFLSEFFFSFYSRLQCFIIFLLFFFVIIISREAEKNVFLKMPTCVWTKASVSTWMNGWMKNNVMRGTMLFQTGINECRRHKSSLLCAIAKVSLCLTGRMQWSWSCYKIMFLFFYFLPGQLIYSPIHKCILIPQGGKNVSPTKVMDGEAWFCCFSFFLFFFAYLITNHPRKKIIKIK